MGSDTDCKDCTSGEGEHEVQEVQDEQDQRPSQWLEEVSEDTVEGVGSDTVRSGKQTEVDTGGVSLPGVDQRRGQTNTDNQENSINYTQKVVSNRKHCNFF